MNMKIKFARMKAKEYKGKKLTQAYCAELIGKSDKGYRLKEQGEISFTDEERKVLSKAFRITVKQFKELEANS